MGETGSYREKLPMAGERLEAYVSIIDKPDSDNRCITKKFASKSSCSLMVTDID